MLTIKPLIKAFIVMTLLSISENNMALASGNGWVSSGGDDVPYRAYASWFNNKNASVHYCIQVSDSYGKKKESLEKMIEESILNWKNYYLTSLDFFDLSPNHIHPNFNWKYLEDCLHKSVVTFYFGVENQDVQDSSAQFFKPLSLAAFNEERNAGLIWVSDLNKRAPDAHASALSALITHELGHAFGVPHIEHTIMREDIAKKILNDEAVSSEIDHEGFLLFNENRPLKISGKIAGNLYKGSRSNELFEKFTGRSPKGLISARLEASDGYAYGFKLYLIDEIGEVNLVIDGKKTLTLKNYSSALFKSAIPLQEGGFYVDEVLTHEWIAVSEIKDALGNVYPLFIDFNSQEKNGKAYTLKFKNELNELVPLFTR